MRIRVKVLQTGKTACGIEIPAQVVAGLGPLDRAARAKRFFEGLSYSNQRRLVIPIEEAKAPETRERRIAKTVELLREGRA